MGYDSFTITALLHLEDLGFCAKGEGGAFVEDGKLGPGGASADEHQRRRAVVHPPRACTACSCWSRPSASWAARPAPPGRRPRVAVAHGSGRCCRRWPRSCSAPRRRCDESEPAPVLEPPIERGGPFWDATRERRGAPVERRPRKAMWYPGRRPGASARRLEWREASGEARSTPSASTTGRPGHGADGAVRGGAGRAGRGRACVQRGRLPARDGWSGCRSAGLGAAVRRAHLPQFAPGADRGASERGDHDRGGPMTDDIDDSRRLRRRPPRLDGRCGWARPAGRRRPDAPAIVSPARRPHVRRAQRQRQPAGAAWRRLGRGGRATPWR